MNTRISLISHATTAALRSARFADDEPLDEVGVAKARGASMPVADHVISSPARAARDTAKSAGMVDVAEPLLKDCSYGRWTGMRFEDVATEEPDAVAQWMTDPNSAPHGGETLMDLQVRAVSWLDRVEGGHTLAITHASIIRAAVLHVLDAPFEAFWRVDIAPLTFTDLRKDRGRWLLRATGVPL
jgi:broad specificity phosphatase PhoE